MADFQQEFVDSFNQVVEQYAYPVMERAASLTLDSIRYGSELTGAPGQPVQSGDLLASWDIDDVGAGSFVVFSELPYASNIEAGVGPYGALTLRSKVGGFHSVALTAAAFDRILDRASQDVLGGYDPSTGQFRGQSGRFVSRTRVAQAHKRAVRNARRRAAYRAKRRA